jgi:hypothetical protein
MGTMVQEKITFGMDGDEIVFQVTEASFGMPEKIIYQQHMAKESAMLLAQHVFDLCGQKSRLDKLEELRDEIHSAACALTGLIEDMGEELNNGQL